MSLLTDHGRLLKVRIPWGQVKGCLAVVVCLLAFPVAAEGRPFNAAEMRMVELAHDYWGKGPACERITYVVRPAVELPGRLGEAPPCSVVLADGYDFLTSCAVIVHEWGHLLGLHHDSGDIMGAITPTDECLRENERRTRRKKCGRKRPAKAWRRCVRRFG